ncbi:MAG: Na+/H+ antiporter subunit B [Candidatus Abyssobacteria bacterium SURF_5]|uniref:Na+/H+ antiporter subunit B n=1 Tax=Abyssobacteria bacterium (strain SURF_5) TaxID=2093360 RepID=A0A3A4NUT1_ABYX5|nr:MAG: Na+/H+ antiporter subunit B [Candidatus Abyssubacteria bacterium SURF_5]
MLNTTGPKKAGQAASLIISVATIYVLPLLVILSIYLLLFGHNEPGGGFVGGLVFAAAFILYAITHGTNEARRMLRVDPKSLVAIGLLTALLSGAVSFLQGKPFLSGLWFEAPPYDWKVGTPLLFDAGIYLVVIGAVLTIIFLLAED